MVALLSGKGSRLCLERGRASGGVAGGSRPSGSTPVTPTLFDSKCANLFDRLMFSLTRHKPTSHPPNWEGRVCVYVVSKRKHAYNVQGRIQDGFGGGSI